MDAGDCSKKKLKMCLDSDHAACGICLNIWHDVVTVGPCLHNFCNGCFSEWLRRSQKKNPGVLCPQCRCVAQFAGRNHFLNMLAQEILENNTSLRRSVDEITLLDSHASIKSHITIPIGKNRGRKRARSGVVFDQESDGWDHLCPQCDIEVSGFRCLQDTIHLQCQRCGGRLPSRSNYVVPQHCGGCGKVFCGAYWHAQGIQGGEYLCSPETLKPVADYSVSEIPVSVHEGNRHEQEITGDCIRHIGKTVQEVVQDWTLKFDQRELDRSRLMLNNPQTLSSQTYVCNDCYNKLISFLLYWFRVSLPKHVLPPHASGRENCWYGHACRTQHHNDVHARKRNHVCCPARGAHT